MSNVGKNLYQVQFLCRSRNANNTVSDWVLLSNNTRWSEKEARELGQEKMNFAKYGDTTMGGMLAPRKKDDTEFKLVYRTLRVESEEVILG